MGRALNKITGTSRILTNVTTPTHPFTLKYFNYNGPRHRKQCKENKDPACVKENCLSKEASAGKMKFIVKWRRSSTWTQESWLISGSNSAPRNICFLILSKLLYVGTQVIFETSSIFSSLNLSRSMSWPTSLSLYRLLFFTHCSSTPYPLCCSLYSPSLFFFSTFWHSSYSPLYLSLLFWLL